MYILPKSMLATAGIPEPVQDTTPSARLVYSVLAAVGPAGADTVEDKTGLARRTIRAAVSDLKEQGFVESHPHPTDARRQMYDTVTDSTTQSEGIGGLKPVKNRDEEQASLANTDGRATPQPENNAE